MASRYPCRRCRTPVDTDLHSCPFCDAPDPLRYRRTRRVAWAVVVSLGSVLALAAWVLA